MITRAIYQPGEAGKEEETASQVIEEVLEKIGDVCPTCRANLKLLPPKADLKCPICRSYLIRRQ